MRIRHALIGTGLGALLAIGAVAAPAQAAAPTQQTAASVTASADTPIRAQGWTYWGSYVFYVQCKDAGYQTHLPYYCYQSPHSGLWDLFVWR
ncbi:hypothetical protein [Streptomyces sp. 4N124]|uniref:hypothetical protein n=1 Tax=Streptomyces sp. 4N124 TaxID=3457420 RepID=UPI003FD595D1